MIVLTVIGLALLLSAPLIARIAVGRDRDSVALTRILQVIGVACLLGALLTRPRNLDTTAVPPPPDMIESGDR
jgi:hypothetical protein